MSANMPRQRPSVPVLMATGLLAITLGIAAVSRLSQPVPSETAGMTPLATRLIQFSDLPNGGVRVTDASNGQVLEVMAPESNNFVRATMRGLVRQRVREGLGPEVPFRLSAWPDGGLTLDDPATHRSIELAAFGATNAADFARILSLQAAPK